MSKNKKELSNTELALQKQLGTKTKEQLSESAAKAFFSVEDALDNWLAHAVKFGLCAIAIKSVVGHGRFTKWLEKAIADYANGPRKRATRCTSAGGDSLRTAKLYITVANKMLRQIETPNEGTVFGKKFLQVCAEEKWEPCAAAVLAFPESTEKFVERMTEGFSLRSLISCLNEANADALAEEDEEANTLDEQPDGTFASRGGKGGEEESPQLLLWDDWTNELGNIDTLLKHKDAIQLEDKHWLQIEEKLRAQLAEVEKITSAIKARK